MKAGGPSYMSLYELARMNYDRELYAEANTYFQDAYTEMEAEQADTRDPVGYADFLDEYAFSLEQTGQNGLASKLSARSEKIRVAFKAKQSHTEKTPYGTLCNTGS